MQGMEGRGHQRHLQRAAEVAKESDKNQKGDGESLRAANTPWSASHRDRLQLKPTVTSTLEQHRDPSMHVTVLILSVPSTSVTLKEKHSLSQEKKNCFAELLHQAGVMCLSPASFSAGNC